MPHDHGAVLQFDEGIGITLSTLGSGTAIIGNTIIDASRLQGFHLIWVKIAGFLKLKTTAEGPISWGICANLTALELEAIIEDDPQDASVPTKTGPGSWYMPIGLVGLDATECDLLGGDNQDAQIVGKYVKFPVKWTIPEGKSFNVWAYNHDVSALTTGAVMVFQMQFFGAWLRD